MNTSQPNHNPDGSDDLDTLLDAAYTRLVDDLTATLDLGAGAAQATHPATYSALTNDLAQHLNLDAGLAAIITGGSLPPLNDTQPHQPAPPHLAINQTQDLEHLRFLDAPTRLALRAAPAFRSLRDALELRELIARALDLTEQSKRAPTINFALDLARTLDHPLARAHDLAHDLDRDLAHDRARDLAHELDRARDLAHELDRARDLVRARDLDHDLDHDLVRDLAHDLDRTRTLVRDLDLVRDLAHDLDLARTLAHDLDRALNLDFVRDLDLARTLARTLARAFDLARTLARALDLAHPIGDALQLALTVTLGLTHHAASGYGRILGLRLDLGEGYRLDQSAVTRARMALAEVGDDFVGADLRSAQMHSDIIGLVGVRWSNDTQWPSEWMDDVRAASDEIEHGLFQITRTDGRRSPSYAAT